ncbi:hypothetical protein PIB30_067867 [Stylosanthes scabra]|uniref:Uncharacterized protein n=1 Tax=Stylosanthes scabra TaxID=79078 RepID=A0ABU6XKJ3_9FABA|nr:hypothetical protein [Stylosanthes scabra]
MSYWDTRVLVRLDQAEYVGATWLLKLRRRSGRGAPGGQPERTLRRSMSAEYKRSVFDPKCHAVEILDLRGIGLPHSGLRICPEQCPKLVKLSCWVCTCLYENQYLGSSGKPQALDKVTLGSLMDYIGVESKRSVEQDSLVKKPGGRNAPKSLEKKVWDYAAGFVKKDITSASRVLQVFCGKDLSKNAPNLREYLSVTGLLEKWFEIRGYLALEFPLRNLGRASPEEWTGGHRSQVAPYLEP